MTQMFKLCSLIFIRIVHYFIIQLLTVKFIKKNASIFRKYEASVKGKGVVSNVFSLESRDNGEMHIKRINH